MAALRNQVAYNLAGQGPSLPAAWRRAVALAPTPVCDASLQNQAENGRVRAEIRSAEGTVDVLRTRAEDTAGMPQVLDYVKQKAEMYELQNALRNWERKVEIATMGAKRAKALQAAAELGQIPGHVQL